MPHHHLILTTTCEAGTVILFSRMSKLRLRQSETALSFSSDCRAPGASGNCRRRLPGNRARPAPSPPHFRPCALGLWRTALSGRDGSFPLTPSDANAKAGTNYPHRPLRAALLGLSSILYRPLHPFYRGVSGTTGADDPARAPL